MKSANSRITLFKEAIKIEEERSVLQSKLDALAGRLSAIHRELFANKTDGSGASSPAMPVGRRRKVRAPRGALKTQTRVKTTAATDSGKTRRTGLSKRGKLAEAIFAAFKTGGEEGVRVSELSKKFRLPVRNLFVWFATTGKKYKGIKKIAPGRYRFDG